MDLGTESFNEDAGFAEFFDEALIQYIDDISVVIDRHIDRMVELVIGPAVRSERSRESSRGVEGLYSVISCIGDPDVSFLVGCAAFRNVKSSVLSGMASDGVEVGERCVEYLD